jgi:UDP-N-acetylglucosamine 2-epimerase (non-hydrolysing)
MNKKNILVCFGTRPEYIKLKSLINNIPNIKTCFTGQHEDLLKNIQVDYCLKIDDSLCENRLNCITMNILKHTHIFNNIDYVIVQGDTTTAFTIALSAFHNNVKIIHLEAGLRSCPSNIKDPYPEELNRQLISRMADIHLCPTEFNKQNLLKENVHGDIYVVGNTGLDNLDKHGCVYNNKVLITLHRRDNHLIMGNWFNEIEKIANKYSDIEFIIPIHPNPNVQKYKNIFKQVKVIDPMSHEQTIELLKECKFVISDSGGLQEECSFFNKKIIVCRKGTERPETIGSHSFLCTNPKDLEQLVSIINLDHIINSTEKCPYGNGDSWVNIKKLILDYVE